ncbi:MAG TPA: CoA transferase [Dehalococcoidia bacterium]|nr:CoA transferase [Dehalococcoidia bacterium]
MTKLPLEGIRVVELGVAWTGPCAAMILADFGAEVIKVDTVNFWQTQGRGMVARPTKEMLATQTPHSGGYPNKEPGEYPWNCWPVFVTGGRNKLSMSVRDLREPEGREIFLRLIKISDIFIENNHPDTMPKLNLDYEVLKEVKPDLIMVRSSATGLSGPYRDYRAHGSQLDAICSHSSLRGYRDMDPSANTPVFITDYLGACFSALAAMMALNYRRRTGRGQLIEVAQVETGAVCLGEAMMDHSMNQRVRTTQGNRDIHGAAPCGCYRCAGEDRWVNITVTSDEEWQGLCRALGNPPWTQEERFSDARSRYENQDALDQYIEQWTSQRDHYAVMHLLQKEGVPAGPVMDARDTYNDPHLKERGFLVPVSHRDCGNYLHPGAAWKLSKTPITIRRPPVRFGEDNEYVYKQLLGFSDEEYAELERKGHISDGPAPHIP